MIAAGRDLVVEELVVEIHEARRSSHLGRHDPIVVEVSPEAAIAAWEEISVIAARAGIGSLVLEVAVTGSSQIEPVVEALRAATSIREVRAIFADADEREVFS